MMIFKRRYKVITILMLLFSLQSVCEASFNKLWEKSFYNGEYIHNLLIDKEDRLYFHINYNYLHGKGAHFLYAYHGIDGGKRWASDIDFNDEGVIDNKGIIYLPSSFPSDSQLIAIKPNEGEILWKKEVPWFYGNVDGLVTSPDKTVIYSITMWGILTAIDTNGNVKWNVDLHLNHDRNIKNKPTIAQDGTIYIGDTNGNLHAIDQNGKQKWSKVISQCELLPVAIDTKRNRIYVPARCKERNSIIRYDLYSFDLNSLKTNWQKSFYQMGHLSISSDGNLYLIGAEKYNANKKILTLDENGHELWNYNIYDRVWENGGNEINILPDKNLYIPLQLRILVLTKDGKKLNEYPMDIWEHLETQKGYFIPNEKGTIFYTFGVEEGPSGSEYQNIRVAAYQIK